MSPGPSEEDELPELTADQAAALRRLVEALPEPLRKQFETLLPDDDEGDDPTAGA